MNPEVSLRDRLQVLVIEAQFCAADLRTLIAHLDESDLIVVRQVGRIADRLEKAVEQAVERRQP